MLPRRCVLLVASAALLLVGMARAECPNGCSGNGDCMAKDMCNCYKNFQGNDCSERTCLFSYAHVDTPRGDLNMDQSRASTGPLSDGWLLTDSQQAPAGTYEYFHPTAAASEAHFYLECANKGICDRASGLCTCFDGYEGNGCARTTCPNKCNGHGTCHSILQLGAKAAGTLFGIEHPAGSISYDLWDSNSTYGCRCDPWYTGADCSRRTCKVGVDPLYLAVGTPTYETFIIHVYDTAATAITSASSYFRLRLFDYYGESFITDRIPILNDATATNKPLNAAAVAAAIKAVPNLTFRDVKCESVGTVGGDLVGFKSARATGLGLSVVCQYTDNPGKMRIPEIASVVIVGTAATTATTKGMVVTTTNQGWDDDWFTTQTAAVLDIDPQATNNWPTTGTSLLVAINPTTVKLIKLGPHIVLVDVTTVAAQLDLVFALPQTLSSSDAVIFVPDSGLGLTAATSADLVLTANVVVGDTKMKFGTGTAPASTGDRLFFENQFFTVQQVYFSTNWYVNLDKPFGGTSAAGANTDISTGAAAKTVYKVTVTDSTKAYNYVSPCSGRGLCSAETGVCTCFKGYTNDNCNTQNILAL